MIGVVLADDQPLVRAGLRVLIADAPDLSVVGEAGTGAEAVAGSGGGPTLGSIELITVLHTVFWRLAIMLRCVEMAPFGRPVVPDV